MEMYFEHETIGGEQQFIKKKVDNVTDNGFCMTICFLNEDCHFSILFTSTCYIGSFDMAKLTNFTIEETKIGNFKKGTDIQTSIY
jgi:hypothetical protein